MLSTPYLCYLSSSGVPFSCVVFLTDLIMLFLCRGWQYYKFSEYLSPPFTFKISSSLSCSDIFNQKTSTQGTQAESVHWNKPYKHLQIWWFKDKRLKFQSQNQYWNHLLITFTESCFLTHFIGTRTTLTVIQANASFLEFLLQSLH